MGWQDRSYASEGRQGYGGGRPRYRGPGAGALSVTTTIIIVNVVIAFLTFSRTSLGVRLFDFGAMQADAVLHGQIWRIFTATYLHANFPHVFFNMLALYFLGPALERVWGPRQFFFVYTLGGVVGNILLTLAGWVHFISPSIPGVGASGSVLALLGAAAVLFPDAQVYVYFLFPVRIRTCVIVYAIWYVYNVFQKGSNYGGDLCHIGGLIVGLWWAFSGGFSLSGRHRTAIDPTSVIGRLKSRLGGSPGGASSGTRASRYSSGRSDQDDELIDRILAKVRQHGLHSLTLEEKRILEEASERRRAWERRFDRNGRD